MPTWFRRLLQRLAKREDDGYYNNRLMWFPTIQALEAEQSTWRSRLSAPKFDELERHFGTPCPEELKWLYLAHDLASSDGFIEVKGKDGRKEICVWPADSQTLKDCWSRAKGNHFPFAEFVGSFYSVEFGPDVAAGCPVYFTQLGQDESTLEAASLRAFIADRDTPIEK